LKTIWK